MSMFTYAAAVTGNSVPALTVLLSLPQQHACAGLLALLPWLIAPELPACSELHAGWSAMLALSPPCLAKQLAVLHAEPGAK